MRSYKPLPPQAPSFEFEFYTPPNYPRYPPQNNIHGMTHNNGGRPVFSHGDMNYRPASPNPNDARHQPPAPPTYYNNPGVPVQAAPQLPPLSQIYNARPPLGSAARYTLPPPQAMPPRPRRHLASSNAPHPPGIARATRQHYYLPAPAPLQPPPPPPPTPIAPCTNRRCHFHRLRCGHVLKTPLTEPPSFCATNCATEPLSTAFRAPSSSSLSSQRHHPRPAAAAADPGFGPAPFECPVCRAKLFAALWKMDVQGLRKQMPRIPFEDFAEWVHDNYNLVWVQRRERKLEQLVGVPAASRRTCEQLGPGEAGMVAWRPGEARAPYPVEELRRLYEMRVVERGFFDCRWQDHTVVEDERGGEAEPGVVYQSVELLGRDFLEHWAVVRD
ncbi:uncharacterized protein BKCO1_6400014 [Diplodia corticola]|uniref:Uncharacterized protein n=1 Tax=Diplodia corticola TaxID=236234 RepID=A0A1J9QMW9_9PEZI|nr:uncharacterized protein BKCO1_6400014 [Diplodia corticola]OJD30230.1 hypothetical protein BKCO1_6400014 [Diplodia corticola]